MAIPISGGGGSAPLISRNKPLGFEDFNPAVGTDMVYSPLANNFHCESVAFGSVNPIFNDSTSKKYAAESNIPPFLTTDGKMYTLVPLSASPSGGTSWDMSIWMADFASINPDKATLVGTTAFTSARSSTLTSFSGIFFTRFLKVAPNTWVALQGEKGDDDRFLVVKVEYDLVTETLTFSTGDYFTPAEDCNISQLGLTDNGDGNFFISTSEGANDDMMVEKYDVATLTEQFSTDFGTPNGVIVEQQAQGSDSVYQGFSKLSDGRFFLRSAGRLFTYSLDGSTFSLESTEVFNSGYASTTVQVDVDVFVVCVSAVAANETMLFAKLTYDPVAQSFSTVSYTIPNPLGGISKVVGLIGSNFIMYEVSNSFGVVEFDLATFEPVSNRQFFNNGLDIGAWGKEGVVTSTYSDNTESVRGYFIAPSSYLTDLLLVGYSPNPCGHLSSITNTEQVIRVTVPTVTSNGFISGKKYGDVHAVSGQLALYENNALPPYARAFWAIDTENKFNSVTGEFTQDDRARAFTVDDNDYSGGTEAAPKDKRFVLQAEIFAETTEIGQLVFKVDGLPFYTNLIGSLSDSRSMSLYCYDTYKFSMFVAQHGTGTTQEIYVCFVAEKN